MASGADSLRRVLVLAANRLQLNPQSPNRGSRSQRLLSVFSLGNSSQLEGEKSSYLTGEDLRYLYRLV
ncbi:hypothetical protein TorRG33x02_044400 [Trema orientale]|uniref:Uncharacterized protein n=1 Tax=Trema orientale TaxID=63057 RepID=A0A2P5FPE4_TREOI|nr:hypothetical protein TorRG33x02_044400 [Trema orientale]